MYIESVNMEELVKLIIDSKVAPSILITPYLIDPKEKKVYELYYCEFSVELHMEKDNIIKKQKERNMLSKEINEKLFRGIIVNEANYMFAAKKIQEYLTIIGNMEFLEEKEASKELKNANIYYQLFL